MGGAVVELARGTVGGVVDVVVPAVDEGLEVVVVVDTFGDSAAELQPTARRASANIAAGNLGFISARYRGAGGS